MPIYILEYGIFSSVHLLISSCFVPIVGVHNTEYKVRNDNGERNSSDEELKDGGDNPLLCSGDGTGTGTPRSMASSPNSDSLGQSNDSLSEVSRTSPVPSVTGARAGGPIKRRASTLQYSSAATQPAKTQSSDVNQHLCSERLEVIVILFFAIGSLL